MHVQRSLSPVEDRCQVATLTALHIKKSYLYILPERMASLLVFQVGDVYDAPVVGSGVRKPVVIPVGGELFLPTTVGSHPVDMHPPCTVAVEVDPPPVVTVLGTVIQSRGIGQPHLLITDGMGLPDIPLPIPHRAVDHPLVIGADTVPVTRTVGCNQTGYAPHCRQDENAGVATR